jgi:ribosome-binding protein aMBF1 (putative translation factor)
MNVITPIAETKKTVTLSRTDFQALLEAAEDRADLATVRAHRAEEDRTGWDVARRDYLTRAETERLPEREAPIRVWRMKRGITQRALAEAAQATVSYLSEIESGKKPGSASALRRIAAALDV